jgi:tetratricopeptide (TPR) repeat protein
LVDARGRAVTWTGPRCNSWAGGEAGVHFACQGNILTGPEVVAAMAKSFRETRGELAGRLIAALEAGQAAGGDKRGQQSAALIVVRPSERHPEFRERYVDLRVEDHRTPIAELRRLWRIHQGFHGTGSHLAMAAEYEAAGRRDLAKIERERVHETMLEVLARGDRDASLLNGLAWSCAENDLYLPDALKAAERAAALEPKSTDILDTLAEVHFRMGNVTKALEIERRAAALDPKNPYLQGQIERFERGKR